MMGRGDSYGSKPITWRSKKRVLNKTTGPRSGKAYTKVRRVDGTYGHDYGGGKIVWLKGKGL